MSLPTDLNRVILATMGLIDAGDPLYKLVCFTADWPPDSTSKYDPCTSLGDARNCCRYAPTNTSSAFFETL